MATKPIPSTSTCKGKKKKKKKNLDLTKSESFAAAGRWHSAWWLGQDSPSPLPAPTERRCFPAQGTAAAVCEWRMSVWLVALVTLASSPWASGFATGPGVIEGERRHLLQAGGTSRHRKRWFSEQQTTVCVALLFASVWSQDKTDNKKKNC